MKRKIFLGIFILSIIFLSGCDDSSKNVPYEDICKDSDSFECRKVNALRECELLYFENERLPIIRDDLEERKKDNVDVTVYLDGVDSGQNCYYQDFMSKDYYESAVVLKELTEVGCTVWSDYRITCRWNINNEGNYKKEEK